MRAHWARTEGQLVVAGALQAAVAPHGGHAKAVCQPHLRNTEALCIAGPLCMTETLAEALSHCCGTPQHAGLRWTHLKLGIRNMEP